MYEDFLHYVWKFQKFKDLNLFTTNGLPITIIRVGDHNQNSGPDFLNAHIKIDRQLWAGNVEIHVKASDWYVHGHEHDIQYSNIILHVVWEYNRDIYRSTGTVIPALQLKDVIVKNTLEKYYQLLSNFNYFINCEKDIKTIPSFYINQWLERLFIERLEQKSSFIMSLLIKSQNDWEAVLFRLLAKNFGLRINSDAFYTMANTLDFRLIRKIGSNQIELEALFYGQFKLLDTNNSCTYVKSLKSSYNYLKHKYKLDASHLIPLKFFRMRPINFPTIRLSQLAMLYSKRSNIFSEIIEAKSKKQLYELFNVSASPFWTTHYTFDKQSSIKKTTLSTSFIDLLIINVVIPIKFCHYKLYGGTNLDGIMALAESLDSEENQIIKGFKNLIEFSDNACSSQALIHLKKQYCDENRCTKCAIGYKLLTF